MNRYELLSNFEQKYLLYKNHNFYKPKHREFLYDCIVQNIYNTELVLCINWIKPVSRFIADQIENIYFIKDRILKKWLYLEYRKLKKIENDLNWNNKINYILYIWKYKEQLKKAIEFDYLNNLDLGDPLWYPKCCSNKWWSKNMEFELSEVNNNTNYFFEKYLEVDYLPLLNNPFFNFTAQSLSFYYPCHLNCINSLEKHEKFAEIIKNDNPVFFNNMKLYFSLPILFLFPEKNNVLTFNLHFDEIFRVYFIWIEKWGFICYKDFFILSYAFLDQTIDENYKIECFKLLDILILWNKINISGENIIIQGKNNNMYKYKIKNMAKIIKFE